MIWWELTKAFFGGLVAIATFAAGRWYEDYRHRR